jgi:type II secretory pathway pseudopilin PulG
LKMKGYGGIAIILIGLVVVAYGLGVALPFSVASFESSPRLAKASNVYTLYLNQQGYYAAGSNVYLTWKIKSVKVDSVERAWAYPASITTTGGTPAAGYVIINSNQAIVNFGPSTTWSGDVPIFSYDTSQFTGTHTIEIVASTGFGGGGCFADSFQICADRFTSGYYQWTDYTFTETFNNAGQNATVCGNQICELPETFQSCPADCSAVQICGNNVCDEDETQYNCPNDCGSPPVTCDQDTVCDSGENTLNCPTDCSSGSSTSDAPNWLIVGIGGVLCAVGIAQVRK